MRRPGMSPDQLAQSLVEPASPFREEPMVARDDPPDDAAATPAAPGASADPPAGDAAKKNLAELPPIERWRHNLAAAGLSEDLAREIIDAQIDPGFWTREYKLFYGRVRVVLRTRDALARRRLTNAIDRLNNPYPNTLPVRETASRFNLINSLQEFHANVDGKETHHVFRFPAAREGAEAGQAAFTERADFVDNLTSEMLLDALYVQLALFDGAVAAALSEGAVEGFSLPAGV